MESREHAADWVKSLSQALKTPTVDRMVRIIALEKSIC